MMMECAWCGWSQQIFVPEIMVNENNQYDPINFEWICVACDKELGLKIQPRK